MESRTIKKGLRTYMSKKSSFLLRFIFIFFVFILIAFHLYKYAARNPGFLGSNVLEFPDFPFSVSISESVAKPAMIQHKKKTDLIIENTVMFSDFVLVVLTTDSKAVHLQNVAEKTIDCVYKTQLTGPDFMQENNVITYPMLSADEHDAGESRWMVRCPLPPANYSAAVGLQVHQDQVATENQTGLSWGNKLVYEAAFDGEETVAVFVKGLGLNGEKKSKPGQFKCRFGEDFMLITKAITAAQEVIRCPLPQGVTKSSIAKRNDAVQVTIERAINSKPHGESYIVDSIAKLQKSNEIGRIQGKINKHELCACTMVWNQAAFLREWIVYHSWLGIQRWFVYDNNSDDGLKDVIDDLNTENYNVSSHSWPWLKSQEAGFAHCLLRSRDECSWIAFFDVDEFYYFPTPKKRRPSSIIDHPGQNSLRKIVQNMTSLPLKGQVKTNCFNFGPSGLKVSPVEGVSSGYTCRLKIYDRHKSIVRPDAVDDSLLNRIHHFELKKGLSGKTLDLTTAVINHYKYQVWDDFKMKFVRRVSAYVPDWTDNKDEESKDRTPGLGTEAIEPEDWDQKFCEVWDTGLRDFIRKNLGDPNTTLLPWQRSKS